MDISWREALLEQQATDSLQLALDSIEELNKGKCSSAGEIAAIKKVNDGRKIMSTSHHKLNANKESLAKDITNNGKYVSGTKLFVNHQKVRSSSSK